jgi:DNA-binding transcriptional regulator YdaS (Cro superfamily)
MWMTREKVPAEYCPAIEGETRRIAAERADASLVVTCEELRPDVAWSVLREQAAPPPVYVATEPGAERRQRVDLPVKLDLAGDLVAAPPPEGLACDGSPGVFEDSRGVRRAA